MNEIIIFTPIPVTKMVEDGFKFSSVGEKSTDELYLCKVEYGDYDDICVWIRVIDGEEYLDSIRDSCHCKQVKKIYELYNPKMLDEGWPGFEEIVHCEDRETSDKIIEYACDVYKDYVHGAKINLVEMSKHIDEICPTPQPSEEEIAQMEEERKQREEERKKKHDEEVNQMANEFVKTLNGKYAEDSVIEAFIAGYNKGFNDSIPF